MTDQHAPLDPEPDPPHPSVITEPAAATALEEAAPLSTQPREPSKRQKTKQDYECAHCGKKFSKKFNWQSHLASHSDERTYACPYCSTTCARSSDLARHLRLHNPEIAVTCGGLLLNGQRWGCGKSFPRADILRSHHKSKKGRQCIAAREGEEQAGPSGS